MKKVILVLGVLLTSSMPAHAQRMYMPLLGGGVAEVGMSSQPCMPMPAMSPMPALQGGLYGTPSRPGPVAPMAPLAPMPCTPVYVQGGSGFVPGY
jgi:hypothetical protein